MSAIPPPTIRRTSRRAALRLIVPVIVGLILGAVLGYLFSVVAHKRYTGEARVLVTATGVDNATQPSARAASNNAINLDTEAQLATSTDVMQEAGKQYPEITHESRTQFSDDVSVSVPPNTSVLKIAFTADSRSGARDGANALASAYLANRKRTALSQLDNQKHTAQTTVASLTSQLHAASLKQAALTVGSLDKPYLQSQIGLLRNQITAENQQLVGLGAIAVTPGRVVEKASLPPSPSSPSRLIDIASGIGLGLLLGLLVAWLRNRYRRKVRTAGDVAATVDVPCLAVLPPLDKSNTALTEQYRRLGLVATSTVKDANRIVFTTPLASASGGLVATGVALALRRSGRSVALLRVNAQSTGAVRPRSIEVISVPGADAMSTKNGESIDLALERIRGANQLVVIDAFGATLGADPQAVAAVADAVVLVVDIGTRTRDVRAAVRALDEVGAPILGILLAQVGRLRRGSAAPVTTAVDEPAGRPARANRARNSPVAAGLDEVDSHDPMDEPVITEPNDEQGPLEPADGPAAGSVKTASTDEGVRAKDDGIQAAGDQTNGASPAAAENAAAKSALRQGQRRQR